MSQSKIIGLEDKNIFTIECENIILREFKLEDLEELYALTLQPEITDFLPDWKATKEQRKHWLINFHMKENDEFLKSVPSVGKHLLTLGIILKKTNQFIGWCLTGIKDELPKPNREIAYAISKDYRGKGYTTEAAKGIIKYLFEETDVEVINAIALIHNTPSNKVIQKCEFNFIGNIEIENEEFFQYKLTKNEWISKGDDKMDVRAFEVFDEKCGELYDKGNLEVLIEFLKSNRKFGEYMDDLIDFDVILYYIELGNMDKALQLLNKYLDEGKWFIPKFLEEVWNKEEFKAYVEKWQKVSEQSRLNSNAKIHISLPKNYSKEKKYPLFIALHNSNGYAEYFRAHWKSKKLEEEYIVLTPQSSQLFHSFSYCWDDKEKACKEIKDAYEKVASEYSVDKENVIIGGFSQGGEMAIDIALNTSFLPIKGFIALNASEVEIDIINIEKAHQKGIKGIIIAGEKDRKFEKQKEIANLFRKASLESRFVIEKGLGHWFPEDLSEKIDSSLNFISMCRR